MESSAQLPNVLLSAKTEAERQVAEGRDSCGGGKPGPWDQGHWANRK